MLNLQDIEQPNDNFLTENMYVISVNNVKLNKMYEWFENAGLKKPILFHGTDNCNKSHYMLTKLIMEKNLPYVTIFEDDAYPTNNVLEKLKAAECIIRENWGNIGVVQLGHGRHNGWHYTPLNAKEKYQIFIQNEYTWNAVHALFLKRSQYQNRLNSLKYPTKILGYDYMIDDDVEYNYADRYTQEFFDKDALIVKNNIFGYKDIIKGQQNI